MNPDDFHDLPMGPAIVRAIVLGMGLSGGPALAQDTPEPPPQEQAAPGNHQAVSGKDGERVAINVAKGPALTMETAAVQLVEMVQFVAGGEPLKPEIAASIGKTYQGTVDITVVDEHSFIVPKWWWDGKLHQLANGGLLDQPVPQPAVAVEPDWEVRDLAPTCGPCCHGMCDEEEMFYGPGPNGIGPADDPVLEPEPEPEPEKKKKRKKDR